MNKFMKIAVEEASSGVKNNDGGPFGAVIIKDGKIIAKSHNQVIKTNDPTAHAEITAIRQAAKHLGKFDLSDCEIYSSCEPCPMCYAAILWARIPKLYYGCSKEDAAKIGFDDKDIYDVIKGESRVNTADPIQIDREECLKPFEEWQSKEDKVQY